ncbi:MAG: hypothetical protein MR827_06185, partial [Bacteroidales bacterium]|nr:hypothetical protein [Bacteroidales bacterium]
LYISMALLLALVDATSEMNRSVAKTVVGVERVFKTYCAEERLPHAMKEKSASYGLIEVMLPNATALGVRNSMVSS